MDDEGEEFDDYAAYLAATRARRRAGGGGLRVEDLFTAPEPEPEPSPPVELGRWVVGSDASCDHVLVGPGVEARHCEFTYFDTDVATVRALSGAVVTVVPPGLRGKLSPVRVTEDDPPQSFVFGSTVIVGRTPMAWHRQVRRS